MNAGYEHLSMLLDDDESIEHARSVFRRWFVNAAAFMPDDMKRAGDVLIEETSKPEHVKIMIDFVADVYRHHENTARQAA